MPSMFRELTQEEKDEIACRMKEKERLFEAWMDEVMPHGPTVVKEAAARCVDDIR